MQTLRDHPSTFTSLLPNPNLCPIRISKRNCSVSRKFKQTIVGVHNEKIEKDIVRRASIKNHW